MVNGLEERYGLSLGHESSCHLAELFKRELSVAILVDDGTELWDCQVFPRHVFMELPFDGIKVGYLSLGSLAHRTWELVRLAVPLHQRLLVEKLVTYGVLLEEALDRILLNWSFSLHDFAENGLGLEERGTREVGANLSSERVDHIIHILLEDLLK